MRLLSRVAMKCRVSDWRARLFEATSRLTKSILRLNGYTEQARAFTLRIGTQSVAPDSRPYCGRTGITGQSGPHRLFSGQFPVRGGNGQDTARPPGGSQLHRTASA